MMRTTDLRWLGDEGLGSEGRGRKGGIRISEWETEEDRCVAGDVRAERAYHHLWCRIIPLPGTSWREWHRHSNKPRVTAFCARPEESTPLPCTFCTNVPSFQH